jgi:phosphorylase superfamily protein
MHRCGPPIEPCRAHIQRRSPGNVIGSMSINIPDGLPPILRDKHHDAPSAFTPESLLREARRQKDIADTAVPEVCILDPDGDIVRYLRATGRTRRAEVWACYHSEMDRFEQGGREYGIIGCAVGASYAVLVAEQMFASGCRLLVSITSSGQITALRTPPYFILTERALRDEGTSYHYLPASAYAEEDPALIATVTEALTGAGEPVERGGPGRRMRRTGKRQRPLKPHGNRASSRSRWRRRRSTPSHKHAAKRCYALPTSPTRWARQATLKKAKRTEPQPRWPLSTPLPRLGHANARIRLGYGGHHEHWYPHNEKPASVWSSGGGRYDQISRGIAAGAIAKSP